MSIYKALYFSPMVHVLLHSLEEAFGVFALAFLFYFLLSFVETRISSFLSSSRRLGPAAGALLGVVPQCGISVVGADLYKKGHLSFGTILALFISCNDEALPILFSNQETLPQAFMLVGIKIAGALVFGYLFDLIFSRSKKEALHHHEYCHGEDEKGLRGCCGHHVGEEEDDALHTHLLHPLFHSLRIFLLSFIVFFLFGLLMEYFEGPITSFLTESYWLSPLLALVIGLVPNCASSVLLSGLFASGALPFGALVAGLSANAGLGMVVLFTGGKKNALRALPVLGALLVCSLVLGYLFLLVL